MTVPKTVPTDRRQDGRRDRMSARRVLWAESKLDRVKACGHHSVHPEGRVGVHASGKSAVGRVAGLSGLPTCGSVWACPVCSAKVAGHRQDELQRAIAHWQSIGGTVLLLTLTMRHKSGQRLKTLWDGLSYAWGKVTSGRAWRAEQDAYGCAGWVRVVETTHGDNGWHVHVHALLFVDTAAMLTGFSPLDLGPLMFTRWRDALLRKGFAAPLAAHGGLDMRVIGGDASPLGAYFTKAVYRRPDAEAAAWEVANGQGKTATRGNRTPFHILRDVVELGDADDLDLWHEWERASHGRRQMTWSRGIRPCLLLPEAERTDEEVAADQLDGDALVLLDADTWRAWRHRAWLLLEAAEADDDGTELRRLLGSPPSD